MSKLASTDSFDIPYSNRKNDLNKSESESVKQRLKQIESHSLPYNQDDVEYLRKDLLLFLNTYFLGEFNSPTQDIRNIIAEDIYEILLSTLKIILKEFNNVKYPSIYTYYLYIIFNFEDTYAASSSFYKSYNKYKKTINYSNNYNYDDDKRKYYPVIPKEGISIYFYKLLKYFLDSNGIEMLQNKFLNIYENKVGISAYYSLLNFISKSINEEYMIEKMDSLYSQLCELFKKMMANNNNNNININSSNSGNNNKKSFYFEFFNNLNTEFKKLNVNNKLLVNGSLMMIEADIKSKVTQRIINGFDNLKDLNPGRYSYSYNYASSKSDLSDEELMKWLEENKIIENIFVSGVDLNNQLLDKMNFYIIFMFKNKKLPLIVIDRLFEFIDSQYNNSSNNNNNNNSNYNYNNYNNNDNSAGCKILEKIIEDSNEKYLDEFYNKIQLIKDTRLIANILCLLTKRYHKINNIKSQENYYYNKHYNSNKIDFDSDLNNLNNPKELPEKEQQELNENIKILDHFHFISYCFDLIVDSSKDYKQVLCGYEMLYEFLNNAPKSVKRNIISYLYYDKLSGLISDNNMEKPNMLLLSKFICVYYTELSWFENDMKICIERLMAQFQIFYTKQKNYFKNNKYTDEEKKSFFEVYQEYINSIIIINHYNICKCYTFFSEQLKNNMIFEEEEKIIYKSLNENIKKLKNATLFISTIELVNQVEFSNDEVDRRFCKELYGFYLSILQIAIKRKYQLNINCFKGLILIVIYVYIFYYYIYYY